MNFSEFLKYVPKIAKETLPATEAHAKMVPPERIDSLKANSGKQLKELLSSEHRYLFTLIHKFNFTTSYKVGFGSFVISLLLIFHVLTTNETNSFLTALPEYLYQIMTWLLFALSLLIASLCDWSGKGYCRPV